MSAVATIVVRWRGGIEVDRCLESLRVHGGGRLAETILVDSGSGDGGTERLGGSFPQVKVLALGVNHSFAWATNQGVEESSAPFILLLNPDTEVRPGVIDALAQYLDDHPEAAGAVPLLEGTDGSSQVLWQLRRLPTPWQLALGRPGSPLVASPPRQPIPVDQPAAAAWMVRRPVWRELGGLDPSFAPAWWEDVDFCARLRVGLGRSEFPCSTGFWVEPQAHVAHHGGLSARELGDARFLVAYHRNLVVYARRHHPSSALWIRRTLLMGLLARALVNPRRRDAYRAAANALSESP